VIGHIKKRPVIAAILAVIFTATPATFLAQTEEAATAAPTPTFATEVEMERRFNEFRSQYLDDRADSINLWLTVIALVLGFFALLVPAAGYFGYRKFLSGVEGEARKSLEKIKAHEVQAEKALKILRQATSKDAADPAKAEQMEKAVETVRQAIKASPIDKAIAMAHSLQKAGKTEKAIEKWRSIAHLMEGIDNKVAAGAWFSAGYLLALSKNPIVAISAYDQAIRLDPSNSDAYTNRGGAKSDMGQHEGAIQDCDEAIRLDPSNSVAYYNRGSAKNALKQHEEAIKDFDWAIHLDPSNSATYNNRGNAKMALNQFEVAIIDFDRAIHLDPHYSAAYYNRGLAKCNLGRFEDARSDFQTVLRLAKEKGNEELVTAITDSLRKIDNPKTK